MNGTLLCNWCNPTCIGFSLYLYYRKGLGNFRSQIIRPPFTLVAEAWADVMDAAVCDLVTEVDMPHDAVAYGEFFVERVEVGCADECVEKVE